MTLSSLLSQKNIERLERSFGFVGILILCWMTYRLGPSLIADNFRKVGLGFFIFVLSKSVTYLCETFAWKLILAEEGKKVGFFRLARTVLEGESLNYITLTRMGGEPLKVYSLKESVPLATAASSVIVLKFCTLFSFWLLISLGFLSVLFQGDLTGDIKKSLGLEVVLLTGFIFLIVWIQKKGTFSPLSWLLNKFRSKREWISTQVIRLTRLDNKILETYRLRSRRIAVSVLLCAVHWLEEIFFLWLAFRFLHVEEGWMITALIGIIALLMNSFFFFVPWRAGTQEGTMVLTFTILGLSEPLGLSLAILRRMRELVLVFLGLILFSLEAASETSPPVQK
ncbi:MAG: flippase-like domain-containing protein [Elusimicrobia bacterium]|nr:flippase-like domain-containing protein [Elusimicrobiota bacterium]